MKRVVYDKRTSQIVGSVTPPHNETLEIDNLCHSELGGVPTDYIVADMLSDVTFEGAWEGYQGGIVVNMAKARAIHLTEIRRVRNEELVKLDVPFMRAVEAGDTDAQTTIGAEKQVLRDIPTTFDLITGITTPKQLKVKWPVELPSRTA
jgi:hypothetical protein